MTDSVPGDGVFDGGQGRQVGPLVLQQLDVVLIVASEARSGLLRASRGLAGRQAAGGGGGAGPLHPDAGDTGLGWHGGDDEVVEVKVNVTKVEVSLLLAVEVGGAALWI